RGRWLLYLAGGLPVIGMALLAAPPIGTMLAVGALLAAGWCGYRSRLLRSVRARRFKSIDTGSGILIVGESGGPISPALSRELELWQRAGLETLSRPGA